MSQNAVFSRRPGVLRVSGEDAASFLQGVLTNATRKARPHEARYAGC